MTSELESNIAPHASLEPYEVAETHPVVATIPLKVRVISFAAICVAGLAGALCGYAVADLLAASSLWSSIGLVAGGLSGAIGIGIIIQLSLQARLEWKATQKPTNSQH